jgi:hypothetical protein
LKLDLDSTVVETYGLKKQGGKEFTYLHTRGCHPLLAVIAGSGEVVHSRLRGGNHTLGEPSHPAPGTHGQRLPAVHRDLARRGPGLLRADVQGRLRAPAGGSANTDRGSPCRS